MLNIATPTLAMDVHRLVTAAYYTALLDALQSEAAKLGYHFAATSETTPVPAAVMDSLALAVSTRRRDHLYAIAPGNANDAEDFDMVDGFAQRLAQALLDALSARGIALLPAPSLITSSRLPTGG